MSSPDDGMFNDTRGWILCAISAVACVAGACIICVDVFIRKLPGMKNFNIQDSSAFLSSSLSLSFGVMVGAPPVPFILLYLSFLDNPDGY